MDERVLVFIYGTLKRAGSHNHLMRGAEFVSEAVTGPHYRLYRCGWYPAMVAAGDGVGIDGELWRVPPALLKNLDEFEGVGSGEYRFEKVVLGASSAGVDAWTYLYQRDTGGFQECGTHWP